MADYNIYFTVKHFLDDTRVETFKNLEDYCYRTSSVNYNPKYFATRNIIKQVATCREFVTGIFNGFHKFIGKYPGYIPQIYIQFNQGQLKSSKLTRRKIVELLTICGLDYQVYYPKTHNYFCLYSYDATRIIKKQWMTSLFMYIFRHYQRIVGSSHPNTERIIQELIRRDGVPLAFCLFLERHQNIEIDSGSVYMNGPASAGNILINKYQQHYITFLREYNLLTHEYMRRCADYIKWKTIIDEAERIRLRKRNHA